MRKFLSSASLALPLGMALIFSAAFFDMELLLILVDYVLSRRRLKFIFYFVNIYFNLILSYTEFD